ncbi:MAG: FtsH protease activity modulator HflK [Pseudomonadota bacterium]
MSWNNNSGGGGWKSGGGNNGGGPWGQPPGGGNNGGGPWGQGSGGGGGNQQQPDLEEILKRGQDRFRQVAGGGLPKFWLFIIFAAVGAVLIFFAFTFRVNPNELGVVLRFGEYHRQEGPGLHFRYPFPVERVLLPDVTARNTVQIGFRGSTGSTFGAASTAQDVSAESLMLTGDENIVDIDFEVLWQIDSTRRDPDTGQTGVAMYLFNIQNPELTVKEVAESAMREVVGTSEIQPILTAARQKTERAVQELMQKTLDGYRAGILITQVQLKQVDPPRNVIGSFRDVQAARADQERFQNTARAYANKVVPEARGQAERILQAAQAYRAQTVSEARGQADRFTKVFEEYRKAPDVTRQRLFLETMERVFAGTNKIIIDGQAGRGVVPYLPLDQVNRPPARSSAGPNASQSSAGGGQ